MSVRRIAIPVLAAFLVACTGVESETDTVERGAQLLAPFKADLKAELVAAMQIGPVEAIAACKTAAPQIAASLSVDGVRMGRSSHKLRNPDNAPPAWLEPSISVFSAIRNQRQGETLVEGLVVELDGGRHGYAEPIFMQPLCLACHGESLAPDVAAKISELYPKDQATGFRDGDFRGVFWVEF
ncbi:MAG: DUF3365 domain-containing protein [Woeseiaceae bacterium]|nr:DUF3365 domain-containing protein [Woeseiaceae bacterium]